jgi:hypothetical protein
LDILYHLPQTLSRGDIVDHICQGVLMGQLKSH